MYAVIFRAEIDKLDDAYAEMVAQMREKALGQYGCLDIVSVVEGSLEITISYWDNEDHIRVWKRDAAHLVAQELGRTKWYKSYQVQVVEVRRDYTGSRSD